MKYSDGLAFRIMAFVLMCIAIFEFNLGGEHTETALLAAAVSLLFSISFQLKGAGRNERI